MLRNHFLILSNPGGVPFLLLSFFYVAPLQLPEMKPIQIAVGEHTPYDSFVAPGRVNDQNRSTWRPRGAGVGNVFQKPGEPEM